ncbi:phycobiliprotein lyase [Geminocystis sp. NIES-3709]|uniref:phycobiliprotein lyase n=1 Tax=Geminocystis sp. NIES-3709 TaxID=1617448 RepID=UPI0005FCB16C|nr:phycobiliprotein lyase [Geminocystis sp. NIES-3709]BAQ64993.1 phycoerythrin linker protein CpeS homolog [Geminocystis sp. NIES-3709]
MQLKPPMTMMDFFRKSEGTWFSQRTVHHFDTTAEQSGDSNIIIEVLDKNDTRIIKVCEEQNIDRDLPVGGASFLWQDNLDDPNPNPNWAAILVDIPDKEDKTRGRFLRNKGYVEGIPVVCQYNFSPDGVLTIITEYEKNQGMERCWFITDDFRVRVSTVKMMNGVNLMGYCSERRCVSNQMLKKMAQKYSLVS